MSIKSSNTTVSFITEKETKAAILRLVEKEKRNGRKMTFSKYVNDVMNKHIESVETLDQLFEAN